MRLPYFKAYFVGLAMLAIAAPAHALELAPLNMQSTYRVEWNGFTVGRVILNIHEDQFSYTASVDTKTRGILDIFSPLRAFTQVQGIISPDGDYIPRHYQSRSQSDDDGGRTAEITYDEMGNILTRERNPLDDPSWRPEVALSELGESTDPITAYLRLRQKLFANLKKKIANTSIQSYDGRRLAEFTVRAINPGTKMINHKITKMINTVLFRRPIDGYSPKELAKFDKGDPTVHAYFSHDATLMPLVLQAPISFGTITVTLEPEEKAKK